MPQSEALSPYRWVIELLLFLALFSQAVTWLAPAPILGEIIKNLNISLGSAGLIISIIALCIAIFSMLGAVVMQRLGALRALILGVWLLASGEVLSGYSNSFAVLLVCRIIEGIGFGVMIAPPGALVMQWFGEHEWPYINMVNALCSYVGLTAVFSITAPIFLWAGSWQAVLRYYGFSCVAVALGWTLLGREHSHGPVAASEASTAHANASLGDVAKMRGVALTALGLFGGMWVFQLYTAFLPQYFSTFRGLGLTEASALTAILPLTGIFAAAGGGFGTALVGLRKPFMWPLAICTLVGCIGAITLPDPTMIRISLVFVGIGAAGSLSAIVTLLMELPGMTPEKMGLALAFVWSVGYAGAFIAPFLGGAIASSVGLRTVMLGFLVFQFLPIVTMYMLPETGPGRTKVAIATA